VIVGARKKFKKGDQESDELRNLKEKHQGALVT
jgi:hypothetical protein